MRNLVDEAGPGSNSILSGVILLSWKWLELFIGLSFYGVLFILTLALLLLIFYIEIFSDLALYLYKSCICLWFSSVIFIVKSTYSSVIMLKVGANRFYFYESRNKSFMFEGPISPFILLSSSEKLWKSLSSDSELKLERSTYFIFSIFASGYFIFFLRLTFGYYDLSLAQHNAYYPI